MNNEERRLELERKKQKLAEMRESKRRLDEERRRSMLPQNLQQNGNGSSGERPTLSSLELAEILADVGIPGEPDSSNKNATTEPKLQENGVPQSHLSQTVTSSMSRVVNLELTEPKSIIVPQKDTTIYCKTTQTDDERVSAGEFLMGSQEFAWEGEEDMDHSRKPYIDDMSLTDEIEPGFKFKRGTSHEAEKKEVEEEKPKLPDYSEQEKQQVMKTIGFLEFFDQGSRMLERALSEKRDFDQNLVNDHSMHYQTKEEKLEFSRSFQDTKWTNGREVLAITFSERNPELFAVGYGVNADKPGDPTGVVAVFNTKFKKESSDYLFHTPTRITSVAFAHFHANFILAGCYTGQICMWDNRVVNKRTPINRSQLSPNAHTQPIFALQVVGSHNAHNLVSISSDGKMCSWNVDNLAQPVEIKDLLLKNGSKTISVVSMSFPQNEFNTFVVGAEDGQIYLVSRHGTTTNQAIEQQVFEGHSAPISSVAFHRTPGNGQYDFSHLFLSASCDWSIKLWSIKDPLLRYSFETHSEYVYDAQWSPTHPAVFATVDADGTLCLWNLNEDIEEPITRLSLENEGNASQGRKLAFSPNGQYIVTGDGVGNVHMFELHESFYNNVKSDEWNKLANVLADMKASREEAEELNEAMKLENGSQASSGSVGRSSLDRGIAFKLS